MIVGGSIGAIQAALDLTDSEKQTICKGCGFRVSSCCSRALNLKALKPARSLLQQTRFKIRLDRHFLYFSFL